MSRSIKNENVKIDQFKAFDFEASSKAMKIKDSKGSKQGRLHLLDYDGLKGKDRYAVAAKMMTFKTDQTEKLNWFEKRNCVLHEHDNGDGTSTWFKINKNSLAKRLGFSPEELEINEKTGICTNFEDLIEAKKTVLKEWTDISNASTPFEKQFLHGLVDAGISVGSYQKVVFRPVDADTPLFSGDLLLFDEKYDPFTGDIDPNDIRNYHPDSVLVISYNTKSELPNFQFHTCFKSNEHNSVIESVILKKRNPLTILDVNKDNYKKILSGRQIHSSFLDRIDQRSVDYIAKAKNDALSIIKEDIDALKVKIHKVIIKMPLDNQYFLETIDLKNGEDTLEFKRVNTETKPEFVDRIFAEAEASFIQDPARPWLTNIDINMRDKDLKQFVQSYIINQYGLFEKDHLEETAI